MTENIYPKLAQGPAKPTDIEDLKHDQSGITYPNLHRRVDDEATPLDPGEVQPDQYTISVSGVDSYRTIKHIVHTEDSTDSDMP